LLDHRPILHPAQPARPRSPSERPI
jgi:hypothetical protein